MKKYTIMALLLGVLIACNKDWTQTQSNAEDFEKTALADLREVRDKFKWQREAEIVAESKIALEKYWEDLRAYKAKTWTNTGDRATQNPMIYFWYAGTMWRAEDGLPRTWLQTIPDSVSCISLWGGKNIRPTELTPNMKKDLEIFHKKGGVVLTCYQLSAVGLGLPGSPDGKLNGWDNFREKYPCSDDQVYSQWPQIYAREVVRHIIALGLDGFDIDWEPTCGDHRDPGKCSHNFVYGIDRFGEQMDDFIKEMAKYFGPVGDAFYVKTQADREKNIRALFDATTQGYHPNEKLFIDEFTPHLPEDWVTKRYYLCADVPCGAFASDIFVGNNGNFELYFDKHFVQDYDNSGASTGRFIPSGKPEYNSISAEFEKAKNGQVIYWHNVGGKAKAIRDRRAWGFGGYHGEIDYESTHEHPEFHKTFGKTPGRKYNYANYAYTRELIRIADPAPSYSGTKEIEPIIIKP